VPTDPQAAPRGPLFGAERGFVFAAAGGGREGAGAGTFPGRWHAGDRGMLCRTPHFEADNCGSRGRARLFSCITNTSACVAAVGGEGQSRRGAEPCLGGTRGRERLLSKAASAGLSRRRGRGPSVVYSVHWAACFWGWVQPARRSACHHRCWAN